MDVSAPANQATFTSSTPINTDYIVNTETQTTVTLTSYNTGSVTGGVLSFYGFDGSNWWAIQGYRLTSATLESTYTLNSGSNAWVFNVAGFLQFKVRLTTIVAGTGNVLITGISTTQPQNTRLAVGFDSSSALPTGNNIIGSIRLANSATNCKATWRLWSAATTNASVVKSSTAGLYGFNAINTSASIRYLKFYNKTTTPTVGTDTPILTTMLPASTQTNLNFGDIALAFATGLSIGITGAAADADTTAIAANDINLTVFYA